MITQQDLYELGYEVKTHLKTGKRKSIDFRVANVDSSPYLVNLSEEGCINVVFPINEEKNQFSTSNLVEFIQWHNQQ